MHEKSQQRNLAVCQRRRRRAARRPRPSPPQQGTPATMRRSNSRACCASLRRLRWRQSQGMIGPLASRAAGIGSNAVRIGDGFVFRNCRLACMLISLPACLYYVAHSLSFFQFLRRSRVRFDFRLTLFTCLLCFVDSVQFHSLAALLAGVLSTGWLDVPQCPNSHFFDVRRWFCFVLIGEYQHTHSC